MEESSNIKNVLRLVEIYGLDSFNVTTENRDLLNQGLSTGLITQSDIDKANEKNQEFEAKVSLRQVLDYGTDSPIICKKSLEYGVTHRLFTQSDIDKANEKNQRNKK